jgi:excisionase family DNA binding protein
MAAATPLAYTVDETAKALHVGRNTVYQLIAAGELPAMRIGKAIRVPARALDNWITSNTRGNNGNHR